MKNIAVFGCTGSIGTQTLSVAGFHRDEFCVHVLAANSNFELVCEQIREFHPAFVGMYDETAAKEISARFPNIEVVCGSEVNSLAKLPEIDIVVNGVSGFVGLPPLISALSAGKTVALANKESVVCGHKIVDRMLEKHGGTILPVDSEQSAIFQCLSAGRRTDVKSLILTASGGMFRNFDKAQLDCVTPEMALNHPTWNMGNKITVDSSTLFNKGLELMEAGWLFNMEPEDIQILIHPQSIIHSMVEFCDGAVFAQMSPPDMRLAIQYALTYPKRLPSRLPQLDLAKLRTLTFEEPDYDRFPAIPLAYAAFSDGESLPIAYNSGNEAAVELFMRGEIGFTDIPTCVDYAMNRISCGKIDAIDDIICLDNEARRLARECFGKDSTK
ncbi:MAG: 1-deoxy-D-xylulose-5-phosphate reductoisomerase [Christensenellaceae bacterium]|nr:1-deoxy-D-xylulose-5-phosphate reductoisomerase [Christensenellaceae bacterium]